MKLRITLVAVLLTLPFLAVLAAPAGATISYTDDFNADGLGALPTSEFYTASGSGLVTGDVAVSGRSAVQTLTSTATSGITFTGTTAVNLCGGTLLFSVYVTDMPGPDASNYVRLQVGTVATLRLYGDGTIELLVDATSAIMPGAAWSADTWYRVGFQFIDCGENIIRASINGTGTGAVEVNAASGETSARDFSVGGVLQAGVTARVYLDDLCYCDSQDPPPTTITQTGAITPVTNLNGFSASPAGGYFLIRTDGGDWVRSYSGENMAGGTGTNAHEVNCNRQNGVFASVSPYLVGFVGCDSGTSFANALTIRNWTDLSSLDSHAGSLACDWADTNIAFSASGGSFSINQGQVGEVVTVPLDHSVRTNNNPAAGKRTCSTAWAYTSTNNDGKIGVAAYTAKEDTSTDGFSSVEVPFTNTGSEANDLCTGHDTSGDYVAAADSAGGVQIWPLTFTVSQTGGDTLHNLVPHLGTATPISLAGAKGIACSGNHVIIVGATQVRAAYRSNGTFLPWTITAVGSTQVRGIDGSDLRAESGSNCGREDGKKFFTYIDGSSWNTAHTNNGTIIATGAVPSGTFVGVDITCHAQFNFVATSTNVHKFEIRTVTGESGATDSEESGDDPSAVCANECVSFIGADIPVPEGATPWGWRLVMAAMLMFGIAAVSYFSFGKRTAALYLGGFIGFLFDWGLGLVDTIVVTGIIVLVILAIYLQRRMGSG